MIKNWYAILFLSLLTICGFAQEVELIQSGNQINNNSAFNFGSVNINDTVEYIFTIKNIDSDTLFITQEPSLSSGSSSIISNIGNDTLMPSGISGDSTNFTIRYIPSCTSNQDLAQTLSFESDDSDESIYTVSLGGTAVDNDPPDAQSFVESTFYLDTNGDLALSPSDIDSLSSDNCAIASMTLDLINFDCDDTGTTTVTLTVNDTAGNSNTSQTQITIADTISPIAQCSNVTIYLDENGDATITVNTINNGSSDACGIDSMSLNTTDFNCDDTGLSTVILTVVDLNGNSSTCQSDVTVLDTIPPVITCPGNIEECISDDGGIVSYAVNTSDNCLAIVNSDLALGSGATFPLGTTTETYTVSDPSGNESTCSFDVIILEEPSSSAGENDHICDSIYQLNAQTPSAGTGQWSIIQGNATIDDINDPNSMVRNLNVGINANRFVWTVTNGVCGSSQDQVDISRDDFPDEALTENDKAVCVVNPLGDVEINANVPTVGSGLWTVITGPATLFPGTENQAEAIINNLQFGDNEFVWTISNGVCPSTSDTLLVFGDQEPSTARAGSNFPLCEIDFDTLEAGAPIIGIGEWEVLSGSAIFSDINDPTAVVSGLAYGDNVLMWSIHSENDVCDVKTDTVIITRYEVINDIDPGPDQILCVDSAEMAAELPVGSVGTWISTDPGVIIEDINDPNTKIYNLQIGSTSFQWSVRNGPSCFFPVKVVTIQVKDSLSPVQAGEDSILCDVPGIVLYADSVNATVQFWTAIPDTSGHVGTFADSTRHNSFFSDMHIGENQLIWTVSSLGCEPLRDTISIWRDGFAPIINCPNDTIVSNAPGSCDAVVTYDVPLGYDTLGCEGAITSLLSPLSATSGATFSLGTTTITYQVVDQVNLSATCSFDITVVDNEDPVITCLDTIIQVASTDSCGKTIDFDSARASDNCTLLSFAQTDNTGLEPGDFFPVGTTILTYEAIDDAGNNATCNSYIEVQDLQDPVFTLCPNDTTIDALTGTCNRFFEYDAPEGIDNCQGIIAPTQTSGLPSGRFFPIGTTTNTFELEDPTGNRSTCSFDVHVVDIDTPEVNCANDTITVSTLDDFCFAIVDYPQPTVFDLCGADLMLTSGLTPGSSFPVGITENIWEATDSSGNSATCSVIVNVVDQVSPVIQCPSDITLLTSPGSCNALLDYNPPSATDNCSGNVVVVQTDTTGFTSGDSIPSGDYTIIYTATDAVNNATTCSFEVRVVDNELPTIVCPDDITVNSSPSECSAIVNYPTAFTDASDNCGIASITQTDNSLLTTGDTFPVGTTTQTWTIEDVAGNSQSCSFDITVLDIVDPIIECPGDTTLSNSSGNCFATYAYDTPNATDLCSGTPSVSIIQGLTSGSQFPIGSTTIIYQATDSDSNTATCQFIVTVEDIEAPVINTPTSFTVPTDSGQCQALVNYLVPNASDNCDSVRVVKVDGPESGTIFPLGTTTVRFVAIDAEDNASDTVDLVINVQDLEKPAITCPGDITTSTGDGICTNTVVFDDPIISATDNCSLDSAYQSDLTGLVSGSSFPTGTTTLSFTAVDASGNDSTCTFNIIVEDDNPPSFTLCPSDTVLNSSNNLCSAVFNYPTPTAVDSCTPSPTVNWVSGPTSGSIFDVGISTIVWEAIDGAGNTATCTFTVEVIDNEVPQIDCGAIRVVDTDPGICGARVTFDVIATDNCDTNSTIEQLTNLSFNSGSIFPLDTTVIEYRAIDLSDNVSSTCEVVIVVRDTEAPAITCDGPFNDLCSPAAVFYNDPVVSDNCTEIDDIIVNTTGLASGSVFPIGDHDITFEAIDSSGNISTCSISFTVFDTTATPNAGPDTNICATSITLNASIDPATTGRWFVIEGDSAEIENALSPNATVNNIQVGQTILGWEYDFGSCDVKVDTLIISRDDYPDTAKAGDDILLCDEIETSLQATPVNVGNGFWQFSSGSGNLQDSTDANTTVSDLQEGLNVLQWITQNGVCPSDTDAVNILVRMMPQVSISVDTTAQIYFGEQVDIGISWDNDLDYDISWEPEILPSQLLLDDQSLIRVSPDSTTEYIATITGPRGCTNMADTIIIVNDGVKIVNAFTPNDDEINDTWIIRGIKRYENAHVEIYNSWGKYVFQNYDGYPKAWDGTTLNGNELPFGTYYYIIDLKDNNSLKYNGTVTILKERK